MFYDDTFSPNESFLCLQMRPAGSEDAAAPKAVTHPPDDLIYGIASVCENKLQK